MLYGSHRFICVNTVSQCTVVEKVIITTLEPVKRMRYECDLKTNQEGVASKLIILGWITQLQTHIQPIGDKQGDKLFYTNRTWICYSLVVPNKEVKKSKANN